MLWLYATTFVRTPNTKRGVKEMDVAIWRGDVKRLVWSIWRHAG